MVIAYDLHGVLKLKKGATNHDTIETMRTQLIFDKQQGHKVVIITGSIERKARNELLEIGMLQYVDDVLSITDQLTVLIYQINYYGIQLKLKYVKIMELISFLMMIQYTNNISKI